MSEVKVVNSQAEMKQLVAQYAAKNFSTIHSDDSSVTLSRRKKFNWVLAVVCLFIPIIGWIALIAMLFASGRGSEVVEIKLA